MTYAILLALLGLVTFQPVGSVDAKLTLMDGSRLEGSVTSSDASGLTISIDRNGVAEPRRVPWSSLRLAEDWQVPPAYTRTHQLAVLMHTRASSGDIRRAASAAIEIAPQIAGSGSPLSVQVGRVLYEDATRQGNPAQAIAASMISGEMSLKASDIDPRYNLPIAAPPIPQILMASSSKRAFDRSVLDASLSIRDRLVLDIYDAILSENVSPGELGALGTRISRIEGDLGLDFLAIILSAQCSEDTSQRKGAIDRLRSRANARTGTWVDAWSRFAIARSLLTHSDGASVSSALVQLTHVASRFEFSMPRLAAHARSMIEKTLDAHGRTDELAKIRSAFAVGKPKNSDTSNAQNGTP